MLKSIIKNGKVVLVTDSDIPAAATFSFNFHSKNDEPDHQAWWSELLDNPIIIDDHFENVQHSTTPNMDLFGNGTVKAKRHIRANEEITVDFGPLYQEFKTLLSVEAGIWALKKMDRETTHEPA